MQGHDLFSFYSCVVVSYAALISTLAAAEARCMKLEQQLQHMKKVLSSVKVDKYSKLKEQVRRAARFPSRDHIQKRCIVNRRHEIY